MDCRWERSLFAAHVRGLDLAGCDDGSSNGNGRKAKRCRYDKALFGTNDAQAVPAPAGVWLLGTAVAVLAGRRLKKRQADVIA